MNHVRNIAITIFVMLSITVLSDRAFARVAYSWDKIDDGISYATFSFDVDEDSHSTLHGFKVDPAKVKLNVSLASNEKVGASVMDLVRRDKALLAINGGFFTPEHRSIGLIISGGKLLKPLHKTSWWSVFSVKGGRAAIAPNSSFDPTINFDMAIQAGPRLVIAGVIPNLKEGLATRSAVGITKDGSVIIAITTGFGISMEEMARRMGSTRNDGGFECIDAMALDGGSSSQLYAKIGKFELSLPGLAQITNVLEVLPK